MDIEDKLPEALKLFNNDSKTLVFSESHQKSTKQVEYISTTRSSVLEDILEELFRRDVISLIVEGGASLISSFIDKELWDEARVFTSGTYFKNGVEAPVIKRIPVTKDYLSGSSLSVYYRERDVLFKMDRAAAF